MRSLIIPLFTTGMFLVACGDSGTSSSGGGENQGGQNAGGGGQNTGGQSTGGASVGGSGTGGAATGGAGTGGAATGGGNSGGGGQGPGCGDGDLSTGETCDDGDMDDGDGCSSACTIESGWTCTGEPSVCVKPTLLALDAGGDLYRLDMTSGASTLVGDTGFGHLSSLAASSAGLFSVESDVAQAALHIVKIDPLTGNGTVFATLSSNTLNLRGLAISSAGLMYGIDNGSEDIFTVDMATGVATDLGDSGVTELQSLDFTADGVLYGWNATNLPLGGGLVTVNTTTGAATDVNNLVLGDTSAVFALAAAPGDTSFFAVDGGKLVSVARATGAVTTIGQHGINPRGLEVMNLPAP